MSDFQTWIVSNGGELFAHLATREIYDDRIAQSR